MTSLPSAFTRPSRGTVAGVTATAAVLGAALALGQLDRGTISGLLILLTVIPLARLLVRIARPVERQSRTWWLGPVTAAWLLLTAALVVA